MFKYVIKRLLQSVIILFGVSVILYFLVRLMPEDYFEQTFSSQLAQGTITKAQLQEMKELYHLGDSTFMGILGGYWDWLVDLFHGNLGLSLKYGKPVADVIVQNMGISFGISLVAMILEYIIAIPLGIKAACNQYGKIDYTVTVLTMMGISLPTFFLAALLIQVFAVNLGWFPVSGLASANLSVDASSWTRFWDVAWHLVLPMLTLVILSIGGLMRHTRTNMLEVLNADYIRTARAKGLSERSVIYKHAFKNTMIPIVTMTAGIIPSLFGGAMITETVFGIPGIGKLAYDAMKVGDVPFIMGYNMFLAILTVLGTLLSDLMYVLVDPRVKLTK
jgi:peptide/nickel transport system permease protein